MVFLRSLFFKILYKLGFGFFLLRYNRKRKQVPILVLHKVIPEYDEIWPGIHPRLFEEIIIMLKKHYTIRPLADLYSGVDPETLSGCCFITFDDGYKDFLDYAYPILKRQNAHSTLFILPYQITNKGHIWTSTLVFFIKHYSFAEVDEFLKEKGIHIRYRNIHNVFRLNLDITIHLCTMLQKDRMRIIEDLQQKFLRDKRVIENELLSFEELRVMDDGLVALASHSLTHPSFKNETDEGFIETEMQESKRIIEAETGQVAEAFAFPFATHNDASLAISKRLYKLCFTRINDFVDLKKLSLDKDYRYNLARFNVHHDTPEEVFFLINGFHKRLRG